MKPALLQVHAADSVAVCLRDVGAGERLALGQQVIEIGTATARGHKVALRPHKRGEVVMKYGHPIGHATEDIAAGAQVHIHNLASDLLEHDQYPYHEPAARAPAAAVRREFMGYRRADGQVGIRNEVWILCTVGCVAETVRRIAEAAQRKFAGRTDGIFAFGHPFGCSQLGDDLKATRVLLAARRAEGRRGAGDAGPALRRPRIAQGIGGAIANAFMQKLWTMPVPSAGSFASAS